MQANLFTNHTDRSDFESHDLGDGWIREYPTAFGPEQSRDYLDSLIRELPWQQDELRIGGRRIPVPRLQCWMGNASYTYSGLQMQVAEWHPQVKAIMTQVQALSGYEFNSVLINYYRDGRDSVSWHADDEPELGPAPIIASVSFGAERPFRLRRKLGQMPDRRQIVLRNGSLLLMGETIQNRWLHELPKVKGLDEPRINLTFRTLYPD